MARSFAGSERALTAERIKVANRTTEAEGLSWERHGLHNHVDQSTQELSSIKEELVVAASLVDDVPGRVATARSEADDEFTELRVHVHQLKDAVEASEKITDDT